jgi:hypothetical protein
VENLLLLSRYPLIILVCLVFLFHYLGFSFFSGLATFGLAFLVNFFVTKATVKLQEVYMQLKDKRLSRTAEVLNHIKMLKT